MKYLIGFLVACGIVVSVMAWRVHNSDPGTAELCSINEHWDCGTVQHSRFAEIALGKDVSVPVAAIGVIGYTAMLMLLIFDSRLNRWLLFAGALGGMAFALYLTYIEDRVLLTWCLYCVGSQAIITLVLIGSGVRLFFGKTRLAGV
jgi:vitamin-K-epoxide reductase (warfarin-sensitive)